MRLVRTIGLTWIALLACAAAAVAAPGDHNVLSEGLRVTTPPANLLGSPGVLFGGRQFQGGVYQPALTVFDSNGVPGRSFLLPGVSGANTFGTSLLPRDDLLFLAEQIPNGGRIAGVTPFGLPDPECQADLRGQRPLFLNPWFLGPAAAQKSGLFGDLVVGGGFGQPEQGFLDLFDPSTCTRDAQFDFVFEPAKAADVRAFSADADGWLAAGGSGAPGDTTASYAFFPRVATTQAWQSGKTSPPPGAVVVNTTLPGLYTGAAARPGGGFLLTGYSTNPLEVFGTCVLPNGQPDTRCGPEGTHQFLKFNTTDFSLLAPAITVLPNQQVLVSSPYVDLTNLSPHAVFVTRSAGDLSPLVSRDIPFPTTTTISGLAPGPGGNIFFSFSAVNEADRSNPLNNGRAGVGELSAALDLLKFTNADLSTAQPPVLAPAPDSKLFLPLSGAIIDSLGAKADAAKPGAKITRVQFAVLRLRGGAKAAARKPSCAWLKDQRAHFVADTPLGGRCTGFVWLTAKRARGSWSLKLRKPLPRGDYTVYSRATNAAGVTERHFSKRDGNRRTLRVR